MKPGELCQGKAARVWADTDEPELQGFQGFSSPFPEVPVKRIRMTCALCGRRVLSSVRVDHDGGAVIHSIPPHKPKGWWKKKGSRRENRNG